MNFLRVVILINLLIAGTALYLSIPVPRLQQCVIYQYDLTNLSMVTKKGTIQGMLSEARMYCIDVNREDPL